MIKRSIGTEFFRQIKRGKSILLLGPRQTGKTTLIKSLQADLYLNLAQTKERRRFELNPDIIIDEVSSLKNKRPLIVIDEIQKVPAIMDPIQSLIDDRKGIFVLTGSSARKLRRQSELNLLPGRVIHLAMDPFSNSEFPQQLERHLIYGSLPGIAIVKELQDKNSDLKSYVDIYLEEEVRAEAIVRNLPAFYRFLEMAALESGKIISFNSISQNISVAHTTVASYYEILEDCLMVERIDPIFESSSRKKLTKSSKYIFFDMGVRRVAAQEGTKLGQPRMGEIFENFVGLEIIRNCRLKTGTKLHFWRDPQGPEVDWVLKSEGQYLPIEVKMHSEPTSKSIKHLQTFMNEYSCPWGGIVVCTTPRKFKLAENILAVPWQEIHELVKDLS